MVTNDDGIDSIGLHILARALTELGEVVVVAPDREFSGSGASVGALFEFRPEVRRRQIDGVAESWSLNGPPALCVLYSKLGVFGDPFDLVVSGINPGSNVGRSVYYSGTVGACLAARNGGVSGVAVSQAVTGWGIEGQGWLDIVQNQKWHVAAEVARCSSPRSWPIHPPHLLWSTSTCPTSNSLTSPVGRSPRSGPSRRDRWPSVNSWRPTTPTRSACS